MDYGIFDKVFDVALPEMPAPSSEEVLAAVSQAIENLKRHRSQVVVETEEMAQRVRALVDREMLGGMIEVYASPACPENKALFFGPGVTDYAIDPLKPLNFGGFTFDD